RALAADQVALDAGNGKALFGKSVRDLLAANAQAEDDHIDALSHVELQDVPACFAAHRRPLARGSWPALRPTPGRLRRRRAPPCRFVLPLRGACVPGPYHCFPGVNWPPPTS